MWGLANKGLIKLILGGPPCRSVSRLRDGPPGPRQVRGRGAQRYGLDGLDPTEVELVENDTCLLLKQVGLWLKSEQVRGEQGYETGFLFETPQDPESYLPEEEGRELPPFLEFPEIRALVEEHNMELVSFDQGRTGHERRKPTSLVTNLPGMGQLNGLRGGGSTEGVGPDLQDRIRCSKTWAAWSPGLVAAIQESLKIRAHLIKEMAEQMEVKKMDMSAWKRHVQNQHRPYRRDCRRCLEMMGSDGHHRRTAGDRASYCLTMDIVGPMPVGDDVGTGEKSKYMMVSTIAIPRIPLEDDPKGPADVEEDDTLPKLEAEEDEPVEKATDDEVKTLNQKWMDHVKDLADPVGVQNLTLVEPLRSRHREDVIRVASKLYCRYRAMGVAPLRIHMDRETSFLSRQFQAWCQRMGLYQTMTGGDEGPSNGRIESEVQQVKRRLRLLVKESGLGEKYWPGIARWIGQERLHAQLQVVGVPVKPLLPIGAQVTVKTKRWHRAGFGPLVPPFRTMTLMGPSPLMSTGYVLMDGTQVQHSRLAIQTDPNADRAVLELQAVEDPGKPDRRLHGKQPPDPLLPRVPQPVQHPDGHLLVEDAADEGDAGSGGAEVDAAAVMVFWMSMEIVSLCGVMTLMMIQPFMQFGLGGSKHTIFAALQQQQFWILQHCLRRPCQVPLLCQVLPRFPVPLRPGRAHGRRWKQFTKKSCRSIGP